MKKRNYLILLIFVIFLLTSCDMNLTTISTSNTTNNAISPNVAPPDFITAITCNRDFDEAKKFVEENDLSKYTEKDKKNIGKMLDAFRNDGYLIRASGEESAQEMFLYLGPQYNDIEPHISYRIYTDEASYQVTVFCADVEFLESLKKSNKDNLELEYHIKRHGLNLDRWEIIEYSGSNLGTANKLYVHYKYNYLRFWLDDTHYIDIMTSVSDREALIEFAKMLTFEKVPLEK